MMHIDTQGDGADLVLIHGWAMHSGIFAPLARELERAFRLHLVDLPGHGRSRGEATLDLERTTRDIAALTPRAIWLGWSLGGLLALRAALDAPESVRGLVMIAASPRFVAGEDWPFGVDHSVFAEFGAGLAGDYRRTIERFLALEALGSEHAKDELRALKAQVFERGEPSRAALDAGLAILDSADLRAELAHRAVPSLWIAGRRDRLVDARAMEYAADSTRGRFVECNSGHAPFLAHPARLAAAIAEFAAGLAP